MSFAAHGNWCGPGWSAGKWKDAKDLTEEDKQVEAIDALDQACKNHDIRIAEGDLEANEKFDQEAGQLGYKGAAFAALVKRFGPSSQSILQNKKKMPRKNPKEEDYEAWKSKNSIRLKKKADEARTTKREFQRDENRVYNDLTYEEEEETKEGEAWRDDPALAEMMGAVEENEAVLEALTNADGSVETPQMVPRTRNPTITREDRPLRGPRDKGSLTNLLDQADTNMADNDVEMAPMAMRAAGSNNDGDVSTNRQVMPMYNTPRETGFLTETRTAVLPLSIYFSINKLDHRVPVVLRFCVNDTYNIFRDTDVQIQTFPSEAANAHFKNITTIQVPVNSGTLAHNQIAEARPAQYIATVPRSKGISTDLAYSVLQIKQNGVKYHKPVGTNYGRAIQFPTTTRCSTAGTATATNGGKFGYSRGDNSVSANGDYPMAWRPYYERVYRNRHVMNCDWQLTIENAVEGSYHRGVALETIESVTTQTVPTPTTPVDQPLSRLLRFKHIKKHQLACRNAQGGKVANIINGSWSPNKNIRRDVVDEEKTKVWYPTKGPNGPSPADWKEYAQYLFYNDEMSDNQNCYFNCRLDMSYTVQYRDLREDIRFPDTTDSIQLLQIRDCHIPDGQYDESPASTTWPRNDEVVEYNESLQLADSHHFAP